MSRDMTVWFLLLGVMMAIVWNVAAVQLASPGASISETILATAQRYPILPFLCGVLLGHIFWPQYTPPPLGP